MLSELVSYLEAAGAKPCSDEEWVLSCPFCGKNSHLYVNSGTSETADGRELRAGRWICHRCGERGLHFDRLMAELDGIPLHEARSIIAKWKMGGLKWRHDLFKAALAQKQEAPAELPTEFEPVFDGQRWLWPSYLTQRKVAREVAHSFNLGVCRSGEYAHRLVLPIVCPMGSSFTARSMLREQIEPLRYKSGPASGRLLFGWHTVETADTAVVVEGPFDALRVAGCGAPVVALLGKQVRDSQLAMLGQKPRHYTVMLDPDASSDAIKVAHKLVRNGDALSVRVAIGLRLDPGDSEPDDITQAITNSVDLFMASRLATKAQIAHANLGA